MRRRRRITVDEGEIRYFGECFAFAYESGNSTELWGCVDFGSAICGGGVVLGVVWVVEFDAAGAPSVGSAEGHDGAVTRRARAGYPAEE